MVVWKEESYLRTKHTFRNRNSSSTEVKFCEQHIFSLRPIEIIGETLPPRHKNSANQIVCIIYSLDFTSSFLLQLTCH